MSIFNRISKLFGSNNNPVDPYAGLPKRHLTFDVVEPPADPEVLTDQKYVVEMTVPIHTIAGMFAANGWQLARADMPVQPTAISIARLLSELIGKLEDMEDTSEGGFAQVARLLALRDPDLGGDIDLFLHVGTATCVDPDADPDELEAIVNG